MATWRDDGYQKWKKEQEEKKKRGEVSKSPRNPIQYTNPSYRGESETRRESYQWEKDILKDLPVRRYGRSYNDKFNKWASEQGYSPSEAKEFRRFLDSRDDKVETTSEATDRIISGLTNKDKLEQFKKFNKERESAQQQKAVKEAEEKQKGSLAKDITTPAKRAFQALNPFDDVSFTEAFEKNVEDAVSSDRSKITKETTRTLTRLGNTMSLDSLDQIYKKSHGEQAPQFTNEDRSTVGKVTDFATDALGYLVPGMGAYGALNASKAGKALTQFGSQGLKQRIGSEAAKGAIAGGALAGAEVGIREGLNPNDYTAKDNLIHLGIGVGAGAVADPLLYGAGRVAQNALSKYAKGTVPTYSGAPTQSVVDSLPNSSLGRVGNQSDELFSRLSSVNRNNNPLEVPENLRSYYQSQNRLNQLAPEVEGYNRELQEAIEQQYQYLKNSMGKGVQPGGVVKDSEGYVTSAYGRVSNNPKWYQDFYSANGRKPTNQELRELAEQQVREGFEDEVGSLPAWSPKAVQEIDDQINDLNFLLSHEPHQESAIRPIIQALEEDRNGIMQSIEGARNEYANLSQQVEQIRPQQEVAATVEPSVRGANPSQPLRAGRDFEPIESLSSAGNGGRLIRVPEVDRTPIDINNPKEIVKRQIDIDGKREKSKWSFDKAYTAVVSDLHPVNKATRDLGGKNLEIEKDPHKLAQLARGAAGKAETHLRGGFFNEQKQKIGASLQEIIKPVEKKMDDFLAYLTSKRAIDYDEKSLVAGIKPKDVEGMSDRQLADATIRQLEAESPEFKAQQEKLVKYSHNLMNELKESGYYTKEALEKIFKENPNYVPMNRVQEPRVRGFEPLTNPKKKFASLTNPIKQRTGSEKPIINPVESLVKNTYAINNIAERNKAGVALFNLLEQAPDNKWGRIVGKTKQDSSVDNLSSVLDEVNVQMNDGRTDAIDNLFKGEGNKVYVYKDGYKVEMELQEDLYKAMLSLDAQKQNFFFKMMSVPASTLRQGAVLSPDFGPVNIFRDQLSAWINSKYGFVPFVDMAKGMKSVLKQDGDYWLWKQSGGANSVLSTLDREYLQQDIRKMVKQSLGKKVKNAAKSPLKTALEPLRKLSEITEEATRVGEFKKGLKKGATPLEAAHSSRDLIDFSRAGNIGRQYNQVTAFFNAAVQSTDKLIRTFKERPIEAPIKALTGITLPSMVAYYYNHDKEWYKEIPQRERDLYWHFEIDDQIYKLPKPFEAGIMFGTSFERMLDYMKTNDAKAFEGFGKTVRDAFTPNWIPTAVLPWIEVYANNSMHFDSPIVPRREQDMLPEDQYGPYQSELSKVFGSLTKTSPRKAEHVFRGYTGGLGKYFLQLSDMGAQVTGTERPEMPDRGMADLPIVNRFVVKNLEGSNQSINDFYDRMDALRRENLSAKKNDPSHENTGAFKKINKISREISDLQAEKRDIIADMNMDGKEKARRIKYIDQDITELAKQGKDLK